MQNIEIQQIISSFLLNVPSVPAPAGSGLQTLDIPDPVGVNTGQGRGSSLRRSGSLGLTRQA